MCIKQTERGAHTALHRKPNTDVYMYIYIICIYYIEWGGGGYIMELQRRDSETFDRWDVL